MNVINVAGVSQSQDPVNNILEKVIGPDGSCIIISSQSGYGLGVLSQDENELLTLTPIPKNF